MPSGNEKSEMPHDGERLIQDVVAELGWSADAATVAEKVRRLDIGLPAEDELSVICAWLGKCELLHKLDQQQVPLLSTKMFQVPDLLAKFSTQATKVPVLIEVKTKQGNTLSFQPDYLRRLTNYAELVGMSLLIAWKYYGVWVLFEAKHLKRIDKNFNISVSTAMRENLLSSLAGDVAYKVGAGAGVHLRFRKDNLIGVTETEDRCVEQWITRIDDVAFSDYEGNRLREVNTDVQSLFTSWELAETTEHSDTHIHLHAVSKGDRIQFAHMALVRQLHWESQRDGRPHWRPLLRKEQVTTNIANFSAALDEGFNERIVSHIFHLRPNTLPDFLKNRR